MRKTSKHQIFLVILIATVGLTLSGVASAKLNSSQSVPRVRVIAHTTSFFNKTLFRLKGCTITHELADATALSCPENVKISNSEPDTIFHVLDLISDAQINANQVWSNPGYMGNGVTVAVLDTGIDSKHPQLISSSGLVDPTNGHCFATAAADCGNGFFDDNGHGTHVSGIITSDGLTDANNPQGYTSKGIAPNANIWMAKVCDGSGDCYSSDIAAAIQYVVNNHIAKVMNISLGGGGTSSANCDNDYLASQVNWAYNNGVVAVVAAGNSGSRTVSSPACASKAVAVAAVDNSNNLASFSSYGNAMKDHGIAAPGVNIFSTLPSDSYASWSGTSMATPHVSATIALMLQGNPNLTPANIRSNIFSAANCLSGKYGTCPNNYIGYGRVDALRSATSFLSASASPTSISTTQSSTITAITSNNKSGVLVSLTASIGSLSAPTCTTDSTGKCSVSFSSPTAGTATIIESAVGYTPFSINVTITKARIRR
jgi:subtilisin family serine protease